MVNSETYDKIYIRDLLCRCVIGINDDERREKQDVIINIEIYTDLSKAGQSDDINDTVNYKTIKKTIIKLVDESSFLLLEKLADQIARYCLTHEKIRKVKITIDKPGALRFAQSVAVEIIRSSSDYE